MIDQILLDGGLGETRIALMAQGRLVELHYFRDDDPPPAGTVYRARVRTIAPGHSGAFLDLDGKAQGFLKVRKGTAMPIEGAALTVAIRAAAAGDKLAICTTSLPAGLPALKDHTAPARLYIPDPPWGPLLVMHPEAEIITGSHDLAAQIKPIKSTVHQGVLFDDFGVETEIARIIKGVFPLAHGATLRQTATPALTAWDVDMGGANLRGNNSALTVNLAAAAEVARQLRLQQLGGLMIIDFLKMDRAGQTQVQDALTAALAPDLTPTQVGRFSRLGLLELSRTRRGRPLPEVLTTPAPSLVSLATAGYNLLRAARQAQAADPGGVLVLRVPPALAKWLEAGPLARLAARTGRMPVVEIDLGRDTTDAEVYTRQP